VSAIFYPGTKWIDPEFVNSKYDGKLLGMPGQLPVFVLHAVFCVGRICLGGESFGCAQG